MATASFSGRTLQGAHTSPLQAHQRIVSFRQKRGRCYAVRTSPILSAAKGTGSGNRRVIRGPCFVTRDNIDTDQIIPAEYLTLVPSKAEEYEKLGSYALIGLPTELYTKRFIEDGEMKTKYPVVIGGENFGCGSSREHAPVAMGAAGARVVVAQTYARIFFRNCVSTGELYPCETGVRLCDELETDEEVEVDMESDVLTVLRTGKQYPLTPIGDAGPVVDAGGIFEYARQTGMMKATVA
ncbi:Plasma membrane sulfite pump involved in sulfite metabolism [Coccomyxa viridis]|uniref:3-isopropylmalate dehydratase n=1 Tax=Coccomyxa viridis TaxID=1274662 RepID=A0AAV1IFT6_9CHLO|nr:Plasma membrane sulfite pump involved in sulfite metabolism [Coccomyxa viridis]